MGIECHLETSRPFTETMGKEGQLAREDRQDRGPVLFSLQLIPQPPQSLLSTCLVDPRPVQSLSPDQRGQLWQSQPVEEEMITRNLGVSDMSLFEAPHSPSHTALHTVEPAYASEYSARPQRMGPVGITQQHVSILTTGMPSCSGQLPVLLSSLGPL